MKLTPSLHLHDLPMFGVFGIHTYTVKLLERSCCLFNSGRYSDHTFASRSRRQSSVFRSSNHMVIGLAPSR
ncbi:hypothetical protein Q3G72_033854 [Acer saccharum]|nr:hypothetical protein Q3G72_033854 [Acer saccharum]